MVGMVVVSVMEGWGGGGCYLLHVQCEMCCAVLFLTWIGGRTTSSF